MNEMVGIVTIVVLVLAAVAMIGIAVWQRKRLHKRLRLELANAGNVRSRYELRAEDPHEALAFEFSLDGDALPDGSVTESQETVTAAVAPSGDGREGAPTTAASVGGVATPGADRMAQGQQAAQKGQDAAKQAMGAGGAIADLLTTVGRLLPRSIGAPLLQAAGQMRSGEAKAKRIQQTPGRVSAQTKRVAGAVPDGVTERLVDPTKATTAPAAEDAASAAAQPSPGEAVPAGQERAAPLTRTRLQSWVQTPAVEPGDKLHFDLVVRPVRANKTRHYSFEVFSRSVEGEEVEAVRDEWYIEISGVSGLRRYHPYLLVGALAILAVLVTSWLAGMGLVG